MATIAAFEGFYGGSHRSWLDGFKQHSRHDIRVFGLPDRFWKWRMHGGAITLADAFLSSGCKPDILLATDMIDLNVFLGLARQGLEDVPVVLYMHENQITYPWSDQDRDVAAGRNHHYGFINYASALAADLVLFSSTYHRNAFFDALPAFLRMFPDHQNMQTVQRLQDKSTVLRLSLDLLSLDTADACSRSDQPVVMWNHRWEYDKRPEAFFNAMYALQELGCDFKLIVAGTCSEKYPVIFDEARERLSDRILHWGTAASPETYAGLLHAADLLPVTSGQDFFGMSVVEAMYCNVYPLLPDRLAFPEHIPEPFRADHLYKDDHDLLDRLEYLLSNGVPRVNARNWVEKYDWKKQIGVYDDLFQRLVGN